MIVERIEVATIGLQTSKALLAHFERSVRNNLPRLRTVQPTNQNLTHHDIARDRRVLREWTSDQLLEFFQSACTRYGLPDVHVEFGDSTEFVLPDTILLNQHASNAIANHLYVAAKHENEMSITGAISTNLQQLVADFTHEMVHAIQHSRSAVDSYRSYTTSQDEFYKKLVDGVHDIDYYASPEEIAAYAHEEALSILQHIDSLPDPKQSLDTAMQQLVIINKNYKQFSKDNPIHRKVLKRYLKKVYLELDSYRDTIKGE